MPFHQKVKPCLLAGTREPYGRGFSAVVLLSYFPCQPGEFKPEALHKRVHSTKVSLKCVRIRLRSAPIGYSP